MATARPGDSHRALARSKRRAAWDALTQNVDGLHDAAGSRQTIDLHGRIDTVRCLRLRDAHAACRNAADAACAQPRVGRSSKRRAAPDGDADVEDQSISPASTCRLSAHCGGMLKPDVVFFGESVPRERVQPRYAALSAADAMLVVGSSLMVYSGFRFVQAAVAAGKPMAAVNLGRTRADDLLALKVAQPVGEALTALADQLRA